MDCNSLFHPLPTLISRLFCLPIIIRTRSHLITTSALDDDAFSSFPFLSLLSLRRSVRDDDEHNQGKEERMMIVSSSSSSSTPSSSSLPLHWWSIIILKGRRRQFLERQYSLREKYTLQGEKHIYERGNFRRTQLIQDLLQKRGKRSYHILRERGYTHADIKHIWTGIIISQHNWKCDDYSTGEKKTRTWDTELLFFLRTLTSLPFRSHYTLTSVERGEGWNEDEVKAIARSHPLISS